MTEIDPQKLDQAVNKVFGDLGAAASQAMAMLGDRLGLFKALADSKPTTSAALAKKTGLHERYVREWLAAMAAADYVSYDAAARRFALSPENAVVLAAEGHPAFFGGAFDVLQAMFLDADKVMDAFKTGQGVGWHEHASCLFRGTERFFRPGYNANLVSAWIPALHGIEEKLKQGAVVADVGCGHGASTILMAQAYPRSKFYGFDYHAPSISRAKQAAKEAGVEKRITFQKAAAKDFPGKNYDLVAFFDCLHDMGDPVGAGAHVKETLAPDGAWMIVEPFANDDLADNLNPVGRIFYSASTMVCTPASLSQEVGLGLGAQAGEKRLKAVVKQAGFKKFRRATETQFNLVFEARA